MRHDHTTELQNARLGSPSQRRARATTAFQGACCSHPAFFKKNSQSMIPSFMSSTSQYKKIPSPSIPHPKTQTADLHRVWTELCRRENQARIRNYQLLQDFAALEAQLAALAAKTDALRRWTQDSEELLLQLKRNLPRHQGPPRRQGWTLDKPPELLARPHTAKCDRQLPFEVEYQTEMLPFAPFDIAPTHAPAAPPGKDPLEQLFHSPVAHRARKHDSPASPSLWFPQRTQKAWPSPGQERSHSASSQPWPVPSRTTMLRRGLLLPEKGPGPLIALVPESQTIGFPMARNTFQGKEARRCSLHSSRGASEEQCDMPVKTDGHRLACGPAGQSYHLRLHGEAPSSTDVPENQLELLRMCLGDESSGSSVSCSAEVNSGHGVAERTSKVLPRQPEMKARHQDTDRMIPKKEFAQISWKRFSELLKQEGMTMIQGSGKALRHESIPCWEEQRDGELGEQGEIERGRTVGVGGEAMGSLDSGLEKTAEKCRPPREVQIQEDKGLRGRVAGLEQGQEDQGGNTMDEAGTTEESDTLGCFKQGQDVLEGDSVEGKEQASFQSGSKGGESAEWKRHLGSTEGEGEKSDQEVKSGSSEKDSQSDRNEGSQNGASGDKQGHLEWAPRSQEGPSHPDEEDDAASTSTCSVEVAIGPKLCVTPEWHNSGDSRTPSLQSEGPLAASAESICEEEEEDKEVEDEDDEEEESEDDTDIEAALAPRSNKAEYTSSWQCCRGTELLCGCCGQLAESQQTERGSGQDVRDQHMESVIPNFQEFQADSEEENKDRDLHDKDDFYD